MVPVGSQQLRVRDPAPARQCGVKGRTRQQRREGENGDGHRDGAGMAGRKRSGMSTRIGMGAVTRERTETRIDIRVEGSKSLGT